MSDDGSSADDMRRMLEGAWNSDTMGLLPATPEDAASEAGGSLLTAKERGMNLVLVNLLLPSYDITMGPSVYDEVEAVTFCVALSKLMEGKASIVVRDNKTVHTVTRVLDAREESESTNDDDTLDEVEEKEGDTEQDVEAREGPSSSSEFDDFRKQLMSDWDDTSDDPKEDSEQRKPQAKKSEPSPPVKKCRLTSMFGDATFKKGPDMFEKAIQAVSVNGQPKKDEDTIIILSAASEEETIGIRALVAKYQQSKTIVLVNCKMEPMPRELMQAETIYNLLPLIAKPADTEQESEPSVSQPKVVVLRRFPRDFEVYMDFGKGFELTATAPPGQGAKSGPSMDWIVECVMKQMKARSL